MGIFTIGGISEAPQVGPDVHGVVPLERQARANMVSGNGSVWTTIVVSTHGMIPGVTMGQMVARCGWSGGKFSAVAKRF